MLVETIALVLIGLAVGAAAVLRLARWFPTARLLTVGTGVVGALVAGLITHVVLNGRLPGAALVVAAVGSALLVSVLARPDRAPVRQRGQRRHLSV